MCPPQASVFRVISGGQTGVDRGALDAAMNVGIRVGGWCPKGRRAADGRIPAIYPLRETDSENYGVRTEWNVRDSDATLILARGVVSGGTQLTLRCAEKLGKNYWVGNLDGDDEVAAVSIWLLSHRVHVLNIAGPREQGEPGITRQSKAWLQRLFRIWPPS